MPTPIELADALKAAPVAEAVYNALPPSHQAEYDRWIAEAVKPETRRRRADQAVVRLIEGR